MTRLILSGICGRMGRAISQLVDENYKIVGGIDKSTGENLDIEIVSNPKLLTVSADCMIDFSNPTLINDLLDYCVSSSTPLVVATTGYNEEDIVEIKKAAESIPLFFTANMSIGINLLAELCKKASEILGESFDIEIIEKHHNQKLDSPSGTALLLADEINSVNQNRYRYEYNRQSKRQKRTNDEIGIHALRGGTIVGEHEVLFAGTDEVIGLSHIAYSRNVFASGALRAAKFIKDKPAGLYSMKDIIEASDREEDTLK